MELRIWNMALGIRNLEFGISHNSYSCWNLEWRENPLTIGQLQLLTTVQYTVSSMSINGSRFSCHSKTYPTGIRIWVIPSS